MTATAPSMSPREELADHLHDALLEAATTLEGGPLDGREVVELEEVNRIFMRENWPSINFHGGDVRTPSRVVVESGCPRCYQTSSILMTIDTELRVDHSGSTLRLHAKAKPASHTCGQVSAELGANGQEAFDFAELTDADGVIQPEVLRDLLLLVQEDVTVETIEGWTEPQRAAVRAWAGALHLRASDNDVDVPARPAFLDDGEEIVTDEDGADVHLDPDIDEHTAQPGQDARADDDEAPKE